MSTNAAPGMQLSGGLACIFVTDFDRALAFYRDVLGFDVTFTYGEPAFFGEVRHGAVACNLRHVDRSPFVPGVRDAEQLVSVSFTSSDAATLYAEYAARGVDFQERLRDKPWGWAEFVVRDPDGNLLLFGSPAPEG